MVFGKDKKLLKKSLATGVITLALLSTTSASHAGCIRLGSVGLGGDEGFTYDCTGDLSAGGGSRDALYFRDGGDALGQNSTIIVRNLTTNITPASGFAGLTGLTFASANPGISGFEVYLTPSTGGAGSQINTNGNYAHGILLNSNGNGALNPNDLLVFNVTNGGYASGITLETLRASNGNPFLIRTNGGTAHGLFVQSLGGSGAAGENSGDNGLDAGAGGAIFVENTATIQTFGPLSQGILAESRGGNGGPGSNGAFYTNAGNGGRGGFSREVEVENYGNIYTYSFNSNAIVARSLGGLGGDGGDGVLYTSGGGGGSTSNGFQVDVDNNGYLETNGVRSSGILAQSIGGFGGSGGDAASFIGFAGGGRRAGNGGVVNVSNLETGNILTNANLSSGIIAQSIGGGGGNGGNAGGLLAVGGGGNAGGAGNTVTVENLGRIQTRGVGSHGILAQSIGGGGGDGGNAGGLVAIGGSGSSTSNGGLVNVENNGLIIVQNSESSGIVAQSIGGGGGNGGSTASAFLGIGGSGGGGGDASGVIIDNNGSVVSLGARNATAILAQSIGGGGGNGGNAVGASAGFSLNVGGRGAAGGRGGSINIEDDKNVAVNSKTLIAIGDYSHGIHAQSIGGGGGNGGFASSFAAGPGAAFAAAFGGRGGGGGSSGFLRINNRNAITTEGNNSSAILAQSIGGGGGNGGFAISASGSNGFSGSASFGGSGGNGGSGGGVILTNLGSLNTRGTNSSVLVAQSIGGGGGNGGFSVTGAAAGTGALTASVGGSGGSGGLATNTVINNSGDIMSTGAESHGILAQSIGGGGGLGGLSESGDTGSIGVGGAGGASGNGGNINIINVGNVLTRGAGAHGIFAQSIGGGGGLAGNVDRGITDDNITGLALGRSGGAGGNGGNVTVDSLGSITTHGNGAFGIFAQSIGGGGGVAGSIGTGLGFAGSTGAIGSAGLIDIDHTGDINTFGENAHGIYAQSVDGAGFELGSIDINYVGSITVNGDGAHAIAANAKEACSGNCNINITTASDNFILGSIDGSAISLNDGQNNNVTNNSVLRSLAGLIGRAITGTSGNENIVNNNLIVGNIDLGTGLNAVTNTVGSTVISSSLINLGGNNATQRLTNNGDLNVGDTGNVLTTALTGNLTQSSTSRLFVDLDNNNFVTDKIDISGSADLDGELVINTLNNGSIVSGTRFSNIIQTQNGIGTSNLALNFKPTAIADYDLVSLNSGKDLALQSVVSFTPEAGTGTTNQAAIGDYFNAILSSANAAFSDAIAAMANFGSDEELAEFLGQLTPEPQGTTTSTNVLSSAVFNQRLRSCHQRTGVNKFVREGECSWYAVGMRKANRDTTSESIGYELRSFDIAGGLQYELEDGWYLGGGLSLKQVLLSLVVSLLHKIKTEDN